MVPQTRRELKHLTIRKIIQPLSSGDLILNRPNVILLLSLHGVMWLEALWWSALPYMIGPSPLIVSHVPLGPLCSSISRQLDSDSRVSGFL